MNKQFSPYFITRYDPLNRIIEESSRANELLIEYGIHCAKCLEPGSDTLEMAAQMHKMSEEEMDDMIEEINGQLEKEWKKENKR